jgi:hypothetical protein
MQFLVPAVPLSSGGFINNNSVFNRSCIVFFALILLEPVVIAILLQETLSPFAFESLLAASQLSSLAFSLVANSWKCSDHMLHLSHYQICSRRVISNLQLQVLLSKQQQGPVQGSYIFKTRDGTGSAAQLVFDATQLRKHTTDFGNNSDHSGEELRFPQISRTVNAGMYVNMSESMLVNVRLGPLRDGGFIVYATGILR